MAKKLIRLGIAVVMLFSVVAFSGCNSGWQVIEPYDGDHTPLQLIMNADETLAIESSHFRGLDILEMRRLELRASNDGVVTIQGNVITAVNSGFTNVIADIETRITDQQSGQVVERNQSIVVATVYVINENTMTHITTAQELKDINTNLSGHFILMSDIDLQDYEWTPIGNLGQRFRGMFVNPYGFSIENLTITTVSQGDIGLFGVIYRGSFIYGVILEDININTPNYDAGIGGIAGLVMGRARIIDGFVQGEIVGGGRNIGGIVGYNHEGFIINSRFEGFIKATGTFNSNEFAVGGIAGFNFHISARSPNITNSSVNAVIDGGKWANVGGIAGVVTYQNSIINASFEGDPTMLTGRRAGTKIGWLAHPVFDGPINF